MADKDPRISRRTLLFGPKTPTPSPSIPPQDMEVEPNTPQDKGILNDGKKPKLNRRTFLKLLTIGTGGLILAEGSGMKPSQKVFDFLQRTFAPKRGETVGTAETADWMSDRFEALKHPMELIDGVLDRIQQLQAQGVPLPAGHLRFLEQFQPQGSETAHRNRAVFEEQYMRFIDYTVHIMKSADSYQLLDHFGGITQRFNSFFELHIVQTIPDLPILDILDFDFNRIRDELLRFGTWMQELDPEGIEAPQSSTFANPDPEYQAQVQEQYRREQEALSPVEDGIVDRLTEQIYQQIYFPQLRYARQDGVEVDRVPTNADRETLRSVLELFHEVFPKLLVHIDAVVSQSLTETGWYRSNYSYQEAIIRMGRGINAVADVLARTDIGEEEKRTILRRDHVPSLLRTLTHEFSHAFDPDNPELAKSVHLHPRNLNNYFQEYQSFDATVIDRLADPSERMGVGELILMYESQMLPVFGSDELWIDWSQKPGEHMVPAYQKERMQNDFDTIKACIRALDTHCDDNLMNEIGMADLVRPDETVDFPLLIEVMGDTRFRELNKVWNPEFVQWVDPVTGELPVFSSRGLRVFDIEKLEGMLDRISTQEPTDESKPGFYVRQQKLLDSLQKLKSYYMFILWVAYERISKTIPAGETNPYMSAFSTLRMQVIGRLNHGMVGPYGQYVPNGNWSDNPFVLPWDQIINNSLAVFNREIEQNAEPLYQTVHGLRPDKVREFFATLIFSQQRISGIRNEMLGVDDYIDRAVQEGRLAEPATAYMRSIARTSMYPLLLDDLTEKLLRYRVTPSVPTPTNPEHVR